MVGDVFQVVEVVGETVNAGQRLAVIAVPQVPLDAFQFPLDRVRFLVVMVSQSLGVLPEHGEPHGQMEPVEDVLGTGGHVRRQVPDCVAAVGQERDVLIHLQALLAQHLMQASLWPVVEALDETEVTVVAVLGDGLTDHDLEVRLAPHTTGLTGADIAAVDSDHDRPLGQWQPSEVRRAIRDPGGSLLAKRFLHARGDTPQVVAHRLRIERSPHGKDVPEQLHRDAERHERGPLRLQIQHLGRDVFGEQPRQRAEAAARCTLAGTGLQSWTGHRYVTERRTELQ